MKKKKRKEQVTLHDRMHLTAGIKLTKLKQSLWEEVNTKQNKG